MLSLLAATTHYCQASILLTLDFTQVEQNSQPADYWQLDSSPGLEPAQSGPWWAPKGTKPLVKAKLLSQYGVSLSHAKPTPKRR